MNHPVVEDIPRQFDEGLKNPDVPHSQARRQVLPLTILAEHIILHRRANRLDFEFLKILAHDTSSSTPEYGGFNTKMTRDQGQSVKPTSKAVYTPLIDMVPSDPTTVMIAMVEAEKLTRQTGQVYGILTGIIHIV